MIETEIGVVSDLVVLRIAVLENAENQIAIFVLAPPRDISGRYTWNSWYAETLVRLDLFANKVELDKLVKITRDRITNHLNSR